MTQGRHRLIFFSSGVGSDGVTRYFKGSAAPSGTGLIPLKVYLTHGLTSEGVLGLAEDGKTKILQSPYLQTEADVDAASTFIRNFVENLQSSELGFKIKNFTNVSTIINNRVYFVGTAKIGTGDGRKGGSSVVDTNAKVYGIDNLVNTHTKNIFRISLTRSYSSSPTPVSMLILPVVTVKQLLWLLPRQQLLKFWLSNRTS